MCVKSFIQFNITQCKLFLQKREEFLKFFIVFIDTKYIPSYFIKTILNVFML